MGIQREVFRALDNALVNGYDQRKFGPKSVASDLIDKDVRFEGMTLRMLVPHVKEWQRQNQ
jgi:hypothetical protein